MAEQLDAAVALEKKLQAQAALPAPAAGVPAAAGESGAPAAWKSFTPDQLAAIETARAADRAKGPLVRDPKGTYGLICRACAKPNSVDVSFCTGCSFPSQPEDVQRLPDNIFGLLVQGQDIGAVVRFRDASSIVFDDKYPVSANHLDVIPTEVYLDITVLGREHVPMLERLHELALEEFRLRKLPWLPATDPEDPAKPFDLAGLVTSGYNYPVSVKHLHLHAVLPPFKHEKVFQYPRWHSHAKVLRDLREKGKVQLYVQGNPEDDAEGAAEYQRAMDNSQRAKKMQEDFEAKQAAAAPAVAAEGDAAAAPAS